MRKAYSIYDNGKYKVCMTGTLWIYDSKEELVGRFTETPYSYEGAFVPGTNLFVSRTNECHIVVYDLDKMEMVRKIKTSNTDAAESDGFCFSPDGKYFYCIEAHWNDWLSRQLSIYSVPDFERIKTYFADQKKIFLEFIESDASGDYYVIGYDREGVKTSQGGVRTLHFTGRLVNGSIVDKREYSDKWLMVTSYFEWKQRNFTNRNLDGALKRRGLDKAPVNISIKEFHEKGHLFD